MPEPDDKPSRIYPRSECQADPVFLLQSRRWVCVNIDDYDYCSDTEELHDQDGKIVDTAYKESSEDWHEEWDIEGVFFTREEAQAWGDARHYRWDKYRTFAVSAIGDLASLLAGLTTYYDGKPYRKARHA